MNMKEHILQAMKEQFERWEEMLARMSEEQINRPLLPWHWSIKDNMAHLWAWQQRSIARSEAARLNLEPKFPKWLPGLDPSSDGDTDQTNGWIQETYKNLPWAQVYQDWRNGFLRYVESGEGIPERDFLDSDKYPWLEGHALAAYFLSSYEHHQEHFEKLVTWLKEHGES